MWTEEADRALVEKIGAGLSYGSIAQEFGTSRSAIAGRISRLRALGSFIASPEHQARIRPPRRTYKQISATKPKPKPKKIIIFQGAVPFFDLLPHHCRYPIDNPWLCDCHNNGRMAFCGEPVLDGRSWCDHHSQQITIKRAA